MPRDVGVIVAAAGRGERLGGPVPKQFRPIAGVPLLLRALRPFLAHPAVAEVVAVLPPDTAARPPAWLADLIGERLRIVAGGATRTESVGAGLRGLGPGCSIVLVHDGARPFPVREVIDEVIAAARRGTGAVAAVPVSDTLKEVVSESAGEAELVGPSALSASPARPPVVARTVPRTGLWRAQTPQGFPRSLLETAYAAARTQGWTGTDEAELVERSGGTVVLIRDAATNLKITTPDEWRLAEALARGQ